MQRFYYYLYNMVITIDNIHSCVVLQYINSGGTWEQTFPKHISIYIYIYVHFLLPIFAIYCSPKLLVEGGRSLPEVSCVFLVCRQLYFLLLSYICYCSPKQLAERGGSLPEVPAIFLLVDSYTSHCSPIPFIALLNHWLNEEGFSQRFLAMFLLPRQLPKSMYWWTKAQVLMGQCLCFDGPMHKF